MSADQTTIPTIRRVAADVDAGQMDMLRVALASQTTKPGRLYMLADLATRLRTEAELMDAEGEGFIGTADTMREAARALDVLAPIWAAARGVVRRKPHDGSRLILEVDVICLEEALANAE